MSNMIPFAFSLFISAATILLGAVVLVRMSKQAHAWWFFAICVFGTGWLISSMLANSVDTPGLADIVNKSAFLLGFLAIYSGLAFTYLFPHRITVTAKRKIFLLVLLVLGCVLSMLNGVVGVAYVANGGAINYTSPQGMIYFVLLILVSVGAIIQNLRRSYRRSVSDRRRTLIIGMAFACSSGLGLLFSVILPSIFGEWTSTFYNSIALLLLTTLITYAMVRHQLFDIRLAAIRSVAYILTLSTMALLYFGLAYVVSISFFQDDTTTGVSVSPVNIALALILALIFQPVKRLFDHATDRVFYRDRYSTDDLIADVGAIVTSTADLRQLLRETAEAISQTIKATGASFVVYRENSAPLQVGTEGYKTVTATEIAGLQEYINEHGKAIINIDEEVDRHRRLSSIIRALARRRVVLVVPLVARQGPIGFLLIDEEKGSGYVRHDIRALRTLTDELVVAVQNAISLQEVRNLNTNLEKRVAAATHELTRSNEELKALDETKDEFISMASHQLRTPLTSVKGYISMVLDGDAGAVSEQQRKLLGEAFMSSERMVHLIGDFLNVSRLQTGKFIIEHAPTDLAMLVGEEVASMQAIADSHDMTLVYKMPRNIPTLSLDGDKIRQVIMNFIDNAIFYSRPKSTIVVKLSRRDDAVVLEVYDQGIGVPAEAQKRLFTKFFRADNARRQRPDGTGIGLFLAKKVITAQGGKMIFESTEGKGSVFGFSLPLSAKRR